MEGNVRVSKEGVYAVKQRAQVIMTEVERFQVLGQVALWGTVIEHRDGYRAQFGYPMVIHLTPPMPGFPQPDFITTLAEQIRHHYGCEVWM